MPTYAKGTMYKSSLVDGALIGGLSPPGPAVRELLKELLADAVQCDSEKI